MAWENDSEKFLPAATIVPFDPPLSLLRGPVMAGLADDPSAGSFVLAFQDAASWRAAFRATESKIVEQCEVGARFGCSISVSNKCKPPWWKIVFGAKAMDFLEREQCEEREMSSCMASAKDACIKFAKEKCIPAFQEARIASAQCKGCPHLVFWTPSNTSQVGDTALQADSGEEDLFYSSKCSQEGSTTYKGIKLMKNAFVESTSTM